MTAKPLVLDVSIPDLRHLVLLGGGEFSFGHTRLIDEALVAMMPPGNPIVAFLPTASGSSEYAVHLAGYLQTIRADLQVINVPIYRGRDGRRQKNVDALLSAGMIYIGGGVAGNLLDTIRESPAEMAMRQAAAAGTVIAAIGAAASCFGSWTRDALAAGAALQGLNWIARSAIETGFSADNDSALRRMMSLPDVETGIGLPAKLALAVGPGGSTEILGEGSVAVFRKSTS